MVYAHKVLRSTAIRAIYSPDSLSVTLKAGDSEGKTKATVSGSWLTFEYKVNPSTRAVFGTSDSDYDGTSLTSGTTEISAKTGDIIEIAGFSGGKISSVGYVTVNSSDLGAGV